MERRRLEEKRIKKTIKGESEVREKRRASFFDLNHQMPPTGRMNSR